MRLAARQRPRTKFVRIRWASLQPLLRERDALWNLSSPETRAMIEATRQADDYAYKAPRILYPNDGPLPGKQRPENACAERVSGWQSNGECLGGRHTRR